MYTTKVPPDVRLCYTFNVAWNYMLSIILQLPTSICTDCNAHLCRLVPRRCFFCGSFSVICFSCPTGLSVPCSLVVTCWEGLTSWLSCMWYFLVFLSLSHNLYGVLCQVWYLIVWIPYMCLLPYFDSVSAHYLSQCMRFPTMCYVRPAKPQTSLRVRAVWSEPLLVAWIFYEC